MFVGNGIAKLFERALPENARSAEHIARMRSFFVPYYDSHNVCRTRPYEGMPELLAELQRRGALLAVASNKYQQATEKLVAHFFPEDKIYFRTRSAGRDTGKARSYNRIRYFGEGAGRS